MKLFKPKQKEQVKINFDDDEEIKELQQKIELKKIEKEKAKKKAEEIIIKEKPLISGYLEASHPIKEIKEESKIEEVLLTSMDYVKYKHCPNCNSKIKKTWVKQENNFIYQTYKCKKNCGFVRNLVFKI